MKCDRSDAGGRSKAIHELEEEYRRLIDIREGISREIAACRGRVGDNTRRREDRVNALQAEYNSIQQRIIELDGRMLEKRNATSTTERKMYR